MCPPVDERGEAPAITVGDADTLPPAPGPGEMEGPLRDTTESSPPDTAAPPAATPLHVPIVDDQGAAIDGALVDLVRVADTPAVARAISRGGTAAFLPPGPGNYVLHANAEGHVPLRDVALVLPLPAEEDAPTLMRARAVNVSGTVVGLD
jgi:hypothetical protein